MKQIDAGDDVLTGIGKRHRLGISRYKLRRAQPLHVPFSFPHRGLRQIETSELQSGKSEPHLAQKATRATGDVKERQPALVAALEELGHLRQSCPAHRSRASVEQGFNLEVVEPRGVVAEIPSRLEMKVLRVVFRQMCRRCLSLDTARVPACAALESSGKIRHHQSEAVDVVADAAGHVVFGRIKSVADVASILNEEPRQISKELLA